MVEQIRDRDGTLLALFLYGRHPDGVTFFTEPSLPIQVGTLVHKHAKQVKPHRHAAVPRTSVGSNIEVLVVQEGSLSVTIYDAEWRVAWVGKVIPKDVLVLIAGGHSVMVDEDCVVVEVKQGPYEADYKEFKP